MADKQDTSSKSIMYGSIAAAVVLMVVLVPLSQLGKGQASGAAEDAEARIAPVAKVALELGGPAQPAGPVDPQAVYNGVCAACHATGTAGAPKTGDKGAWAPRIAQGKDTLYQVAIAGKGAMPPKGGTSLSDDDFKKVVDYLVGLAK